MSKEDMLTMSIGIVLRRIPKQINDVYKKLNYFENPKKIKVKHLEDIHLILDVINSQIVRLNNYINELSK